MRWTNVERISETFVCRYVWRDERAKEIDLRVAVLPTKVKRHHHHHHQECEFILYYNVARHGIGDVTLSISILEAPPLG